MRIKKKYVIKEARLTEGLMVDDLKNLTPTQKKILKSLHKKYVKNAGDDFRYWRLNDEKITDELHDKWHLPFQEAFKISKLFVLHGDELFRENKIVSDIQIVEILKRYMGKFIKYYIEDLGGEVLAGGYWDLNIGGKVLPHEPHIWESFRGINMYLPCEWTMSYSESRISCEGRTLLVNIKFDFGGYGEIKKEPTVSITYDLGDPGERLEGVIVDEAYFDLPEEVNKNVMNKWFDDFINNQVKPIVLDFKFPKIST